MISVRGIAKARLSSQNDGQTTPTSLIAALRTTLLGAALAYGVGAWMVWLHRVEGGHELHEPSLMSHWLRDSTLALPVVVLAVWAGMHLATRLLTARRMDVSTTLRRAVVAAAVATSAALAVGITSPIHQWLFEASEGNSLSLLGHVLRDTYVALAAALPISAIMSLFVVRADRAAGEDPEPVSLRAVQAAPQAPSRRDFLKVGATTVAAAGIAGTGAVAMSSGTAAARTRRIQLFINAGDVRMIDGAPVYMLRYATTEEAPNGGLHVPERPWVFRARAEQTIELSVKNNLNKPHGFALRDLRRARNGRPYRVNSGPIDPGATWTRTFTAPRAGTYLYEDPVNPNVNRVLGLGGAFVVRPRGRKNRQRPFDNGPVFVGQPFVWVLQDIDPVWHELARAGREDEITDPVGTFLPRYFNINGKGGFQAESDSTVHVKRKLGDAAWIAIVNTGLAVHSLHWHGNHVFKWEEDGERKDAVLSEDDVVHVAGGGRAGVLLPCHGGLDAWPPERGLTNNCYPMHCHAEMSQTAAGGLYPSGMVTHWDLVGEDHA